MGRTYARVQPNNPRQPELATFEAGALADSSATHLCIPKHGALQLLAESDRREATPADGSRRLVSYVGPVMITIGSRRGFGGAMVLGNKVLLGPIPMEDLDLVVWAGPRHVIDAAASPNIPGSVAKGLLPHSAANKRQRSN